MTEFAVVPEQHDDAVKRTASDRVGQADAAAITALEFQHFQSLVDADAIDESGPAFRGREVVEGFRGAATHALLVVVLELDLPGDRTVGAAPGRGANV
ncbi:hypothetical protein IU427_10690 [Nocardia beijingensis]|uniref:hypothetical protein n=1 Tax=Nocardia beijingensis TaxID=95162 RepID=UPI0018939708|nr:hypothetical protein [Nocardia beijingensis]MBF6465638.1 hypothetical protein [Nocardia beijingensis]